MRGQRCEARAGLPVRCLSSWFFFIFFFSTPPLALVVGRGCTGHGEPAVELLHSSVLIEYLQTVRAARQKVPLKALLLSSQRLNSPRSRLMLAS